MITKDIEVVYQFLSEARETLGDDEFFSALTNFFNVDQLHSFAESLQSDYDLANGEDEYDSSDPYEDYPY